MRKLILPTLALSLIAGVASVAAAEGNSEVNVQLNRPALQGSGSAHMEWRDGDHMASSTMTMRHGTTTPEMRHASSTPEMHGKAVAIMGVPGIIASIGANSFTMTAPAGKDHATTTLTVNITSSTVFSKGGRNDEQNDEHKGKHVGSGNASTTASLANLSIGSHVVVLGKVSTSTNSVAATRVIVTGSFNKSEKPEVKANLGGIISRIKELLGKHASSTVNVNASSTSAAAVQGGFIANLLHQIFGWM